MYGYLWISLDIFGYPWISQWGEIPDELMNWKKGDLYRSTYHWEELGLIGYEVRYTYCS